MELGILYAFMFALYLFFLLELINRKAMAKDVACMHDMMHQALHVVLGDREDITVEDVVNNANHEEIQAWDEAWILESNKQKSEAKAYDERTTIGAYSFAKTGERRQQQSVIPMHQWWCLGDSMEESSSLLQRVHSTKSFIFEVFFELTAGLSLVRKAHW